MATPTGPKPADPLALLRTRSYMALLVLAAILGVPIAALAYFFLKLVDVLQKAVFTQLPSGLGFHGEPLWWPLLPLALAGLLVALAIRYLPGKGGHSPADGFKAGGGVITPAEIPGVFLAALATLSLGAVLGPEAPLIALGAGLAVLAVHFSRREMPAQTLMVVGAAGSFAAIATLFGSPLPAAFLLMEAVGLGGALLLLLVCKGLAYGVSLSSFRGGPVFPSLFLGAVGGAAMSHLPGLPLAAGVAMGIGAMSAVMLRLPLTAVLLATLLLGSDGLAVSPLVIVAVVISYVISVRLTPPATQAPAAEPAPAPAPAQTSPAHGTVPPT